MRRRSQRQLTLALIGVAAVIAFVFSRSGDPSSKSEVAETGTRADTVATVSEVESSARRQRGPEHPVDTVGRAHLESDRTAGASASGPRDSFVDVGRDRAKTKKLKRNQAVPILLDPLVTETSTVGLTGTDPLAPRDLLAWRMKDGRRAIIARGRSDRDGEIHFPQLIAPRDGLEIVVTDAEGAPGIPGSSEARKLPGRLPSPPDAVVVDRYGTEFDVRVVPTEASGTILVADAEGYVFAQYAIRQSPAASSRMLDLTFSLRPEDTFVLVAHEFPDGRRSDWRVIELVP